MRVLVPEVLVCLEPVEVLVDELTTEFNVVTSKDAGVVTTGAWVGGIGVPAPRLRQSPACLHCVAGDRGFLT